MIGGSGRRESSELTSAQGAEKLAGIMSSSLDVNPSLRNNPEVKAAIGEIAKLAENSLHTATSSLMMQSPKAGMSLMQMREGAKLGAGIKSVDHDVIRQGVTKAVDSLKKDNLISETLHQELSNMAESGLSEIAPEKASRTDKGLTDKLMNINKAPAQSFERA